MNQVEMNDAGPTVQELEELLTVYGALARSLCKTCNIPAEQFPALCETLGVAREALWLANHQQARASYMRRQQKDARKFVGAAQQMAELWPRLDGYITGSIVREFAAATKYALHRDQVVKVGNSTVRFEGQPLLPFPDMLQALVTASATAAKLARSPRGRPHNTYPLEQLAFVLQAFWTGALQREFKEHFEPDYPDDDDPDLEDQLPKNNASRFIYEAVRGLVHPTPSGATCRYVMRQVIKVNSREKRRTQIRRQKCPNSR